MQLIERKKKIEKIHKIFWNNKSFTTRIHFFRRKTTESGRGSVLMEKQNTKSITIQTNIVKNVEVLSSQSQTQNKQNEHNDKMRRMKP